jgi:tetratricopeptide (TPR) repeat protein|tara:strand:+ start:621 stop:1751 length:1131 start_codon:yes stop_codon:yes gene_type:complete
MSSTNETTIKQAMQQAVAEHNKGNLQNAESVYRQVLKVVPAHADANHNLGILLVALHQSNNALQFLHTALQGNEKVEQFWLSYINALINLDKLDIANEFIEAASKAGFSGPKFVSSSERMLSPAALRAKGKIFQANDGNYLHFLRALHRNVYEGYFEIGTRTGDSLVLSQSPSIAIDPFFQLNENPIGNKDFCLMFQETSDSFFENRLPKLSGLKCQLAFIDGMHLFEYALKDFINLAKISSEKALFLFHDPIPWTFKMATRNNETLGRNEAWTGDIWKLVHILIDAGMKDNINLLGSAPSGLLAVLNPDKKIIAKLEKNYDKICAQWLDVELNENNLLKFYETGVFVKPEVYLQSLEQISFGNRKANISKEWISQ